MFYKESDKKKLPLIQISQSNYSLNQKLSNKYLYVSFLFFFVETS